MDAPPARKPRLLIVEDHVDTLNAMARLLTMEGYVVHTARGVTPALAVAAAHPIDVVISDIGLPDGDGCELMKTLAVLYKVKGIAVTGLGFPEDVARCREAGFVTHILKPVGVAKIAGALQELSDASKG